MDAYGQQGRLLQASRWFGTLGLSMSEQAGGLCWVFVDRLT